MGHGDVSAPKNRPFDGAMRMSCMKRYRRLPSDMGHLEARHAHALPPPMRMPCFPRGTDAFGGVLIMLKNSHFGRSVILGVEGLVIRGPQE